LLIQYHIVSDMIWLSKTSVYDKGITKWLKNFEVLKLYYRYDLNTLKNRTIKYFLYIYTFIVIEKDLGNVNKPFHFEMLKRLHSNKNIPIKHNLNVKPLNWKNAVNIYVVVSYHQLLKIKYWHYGICKNVRSIYSRDVVCLSTSRGLTRSASWRHYKSECF